VDHSQKKVFLKRRMDSRLRREHPSEAPLVLERNTRGHWKEMLGGKDRTQSE
jgi:hypothetical protein